MCVCVCVHMCESVWVCRVEETEIERNNVDILPEWGIIYLFFII